MANSAYNYDLPPEDGPKSRPVDQGAHGSTGHQDSIGGHGRAGARRGSSGQYRREGWIDARDVVTGCHLKNIRDPRLVVHPDMGNDWRQEPRDYSKGPSIAESHHRSICAGGSNCPVPAWHQGLSD